MVEKAVADTKMNDLTPYENGQRAFESGLQFHDNPYDPVDFPSAYEQWENGYWMASVREAAK